ncbi:MAG: TRAP transporter small permease [Bacillota bacterium]
MSKLSTLINQLASYIVIVSIFVMTVVVIVQVFCRYVLGFSIFWSEELARYLLVWTTFLGGSVAYKKAQLASINFLAEKLPARPRALVGILAQIMALTFIVVAAYYGFKQSFSPSVTMQVSPAMRLPMTYAYLAVPIGFGIIMIHSIENLYKHILLALKGNEVAG